MREIKARAENEGVSACVRMKAHIHEDLHALSQGHKRMTVSTHKREGGHMSKEINAPFYEMCNVSTYEGEGMY